MAKSTVHTRKNSKPSATQELAIRGIGADGKFPLFKTLPFTQKRLEVLKALTIVHALLDHWQEKKIHFDWMKNAHHRRYVARLKKQMDKLPIESSEWYALDRKLEAERDWRMKDGHRWHWLYEMQKMIEGELSFLRPERNKDAVKFLSEWKGPHLKPWTEDGQYKTLLRMLRNAEAKENRKAEVKQSVKKVA